jgi:hypothetical protein
MEKLGRGLVAVKTDSGYFLSWRLFGTEQGTDIAFNVYKGTTKLNATPIATSTNYQDDSGGDGDYTVKAVVGGIEQSEAAKAMLVLENDYLEIPLKEAPGKAIHLAYVGDLDGDGEYEFIVDRVQNAASQFVDAYHRDGTFMWRVDMGQNSTNTDMSLSGPATISVGQADNETVYDIDSDGKAELILKAANGTIFGDGQVLTHTNDKDMFIVAVDGVTGAEKGTRVIVPDDLASTGNITGHFGIAYFDGVHPSLVFKGKAGGTKAMLDMAFDFKDNAWSLRWKFVDDPITDYPNNHNIRCLDIDGDGVGARRCCGVPRVPVVAACLSLHYSSAKEKECLIPTTSRPPFCTSLANSPTPSRCAGGLSRCSTCVATNLAVRAPTGPAPGMGLTSASYVSLAARRARATCRPRRPTYCALRLRPASSSASTSRRTGRPASNGPTPNSKRPRWPPTRTPPKRGVQNGV